MKIVLLTNIISPHQTPLAKELANSVGAENFRYIYTEAPPPERTNMNWAKESQDEWCIKGDFDHELLVDGELLLSGHRVLNVFHKRVTAGKLSLYMSERWLKPPVGILRLLHPKYFFMVYKTLKLMDKPSFFYLPIGVHAARDMIRLYRLLHGDLSCLFRAPKVAFESKPLGHIVPLEAAIQSGVLSSEELNFAQKHGFIQIPSIHWGQISPTGVFAKLKLWGYFVASSSAKKTSPKSNKIKVLWIGRMVELKNVQTIIDAVIETQNSDIELNLYGEGPCREALIKRAKNYANIKFHNFVPADRVRELMREHDIYLLSSNGSEGWGAVINEALEEEMTVFSTLKSGAGGTILDTQNLFATSDYKKLAQLIQSNSNKNKISCWSVNMAAENLMKFIKDENITYHSNSL